MTGDPIAQLIAEHARGAFPELPFYGIYAYRVVKTVAGRVELQPEDDTAGAPPVGLAELGPGIPGAEFELEMGTIVLVGFVSRSDRRPRVLSYAPPGQAFRPVSLSIDVKTFIALAESLGAHVRVGSELAAVGVALGPQTGSALNSLLGYLGLVLTYAAASTAHQITPVPGVTDVALTTATTALVEAMVPLLPLMATLTGLAPGGLVSNKLRAE